MPTQRPKQSRAIRTREKLMASLERLLRSQEFENISVQDIAKDAGVAVGSVYSHFKDKAAFLEALLEYWRDQVEAQLKVAEAQDPAVAFRAMGDLRTALFEVAKAVAAQTKENGHVLRAVHTYTRLNPDAGGEEWETLVVRSFAPLGALLSVFAEEVTVTDRGLATRMLGIFFNTIFIRSALMPQDTLLQAANIDDETMIKQAAAMAYGYLVQS